MSDYDVAYEHPIFEKRYIVTFNEANHVISVRVVVRHGKGNFVRNYERVVWTNRSPQTSKRILDVILGARLIHQKGGGT